MAATPFPFFFPTTAPAYAPTTIFPPPPFGFRGPTYGAPPASPYAAAYPYPHGASAYAPVPDFPYSLALAPLPASTAPPATLHTTPGHPIHSIHHHHFPPTSVVPDHDSSKAACAPVTSAKGPIATVGEDLSFILVDTKPPHHSRVPQPASPRSPAVPRARDRRQQPQAPTPSAAVLRSPSAVPSSCSSTTAVPSSLLLDAASTVLTEMEPVLTTPTAHQCAHELFDQRPVPGYTHQNQEHLVREIVHIQKRLQHQEHSLQSIQGEVANLSNTVAQIGISLGMQHIQDGTSHSQASGFAVQQDVQFSYMPIYDVNDEETDGYLSKNEIPSSFPPMSASATDQMQFQTFERMPVFDIYDDVTEDCSNAFVDVFASTPDQQLYEEEQPETEHSSACLNISSDVRDFSLELQQQDDEWPCNCPVQKAYDSYVTRSTQLSIEHSVTELRLWDPGPSVSLYSSKAKPPGELSYVAIGFPKILNLCNQVGTHVQQLRDPCLKVLVTSERRKKWDPGAPVIFTHMTQPYCVSAIMCYFAFNWRWPEVNAAAVLVLAVPCSKGKHSLFLANDGNSKTNHFFPKLLMQFLWAATMRTPLENISSLLELSLEKRRQVQWDPGIELLLYELLWLKTVRKGTEYALRHLLAMKFGTHDSTYFIDTATTMCSPANLIQPGRNFAAVLCFWLPIFNDMHCCQIFQKCNAISSQFCWHQDIKFKGIALWLIHFQPP